MKFKIPFTFSDIEVIKKRNCKISKYSIPKKNSKLDFYLKDADSKINSSQYKEICFKKFIFSFVLSSAVFSSIFYFLKIGNWHLLGIGLSLAITVFILLIRLNYPRLYSLRKTREIEKNLISLMQDMLVQLNSGVPIFKIMVNLSSSDYGEIGNEFKKVVTEINSGKPQIEAIDNLGNKTSSIYFRRVLWQISNGMMAGSDLSIVIKEGINNLMKEQSLQIQNYGNKLNPIIMFYMLLAVIMPALAITFLTIISSMLNIPGKTVNIIFIGIFFMIILIQISFLGAIKTRRPSLL